MSAGALTRDLIVAQSRALKLPGVARGFESLARQARDVTRALGLRGVVAVGGAGGVMADAWFAAGVRRALARAGVKVRWCRARGAPVDAAARLAATLVGDIRHARS